jgi:hypothetical protein
MKGLILLNSNENTKQVEEEEKSIFVRSILEHLGLPIHDIWNDEHIDLSIEERIKLRGILSSFDVSIINEGDGNLKIYVDKETIGEWKKPTYVLKRDYSQIDPKKFLFLEMHTEFWSVFENTNG